MTIEETGVFEVHEIRTAGWAVPTICCTRTSDTFGLGSVVKLRVVPSYSTPSESTPFTLK